MNAFTKIVREHTNDGERGAGLENAHDAHDNRDAPVRVQGDHILLLDTLGDKVVGQAVAAFVQETVGIRALAVDNSHLRGI